MSLVKLMMSGSPYRYINDIILTARQNGLTVPDASYLIPLNKLIERIEENNIELYSLFMFAGKNDQFCTIDLIRNVIGQKLSTPGFIENVGFNFSGTNAFSTNFIPSDHIALNNYTMGAYLYQNNEVKTTDANLFGVNQTSNRLAMYQRPSVPREVRIYSNNNTVSDYVGSGSMQSNTLYSHARTASNAISLRKDAVEVATFTTPSVAVPNTRPIYIGANNNNGTIADGFTASISYFYAGPGDLDEVLLKSIIDLYLTDLP